jgi:hypothetical protein
MTGCFEMPMDANANEANKWCQATGTPMRRDLFVLQDTVLNGRLTPKMAGMTKS